jgi:outer membrane protein OmpA-like peptidoglycan-associated protein
MKASPILAAFAIGSGQPVIAADANTIPLCAGLTIVTAISQPEGDYESIKTVMSIDGNGVQLRYSAEHPVTDFPGAPPHLEKLNLSRLIRAEDLQNSKLYLQQYQTNLPNAIPGTTAIGTSAAVLSALVNQGRAELGMFDLPPPLPGAKKLVTDRALHPGVLDYSETYALQRVDQPPMRIPMTVNGLKTELPAVHATGRNQDYGYRAEFFFLDDPGNPLALQWRLRIGSVLSGSKAGMDRDTLQVVKITYHCSPTGQMTPLERALTDQRRADVFDVYFTFNSAELREESEPTLREIADLMRKHADWRLSIEGHTDNIAGDAFNLELSKRRAAAVKDALVTRYGISTSRLTTDGHGRSQPVDTNDTAEGRARNRRVELVRQG